MPEVTFIEKTISQATCESEAISLTSNDESDNTSSIHIQPRLLNSHTIKEADTVLKNKQKTLSVTSIDSNSSSTSQLKKLPIFKRKNLGLAFGSLGVIYGDIGTSPLYTFSTIFSDFVPSDEEIYGAMSCIFWLFTIVVIFKYTLIVLTLGPFKNEGGQIALYVKLIRYLKIKKFKRVTGITEDDYDEVYLHDDEIDCSTTSKNNFELEEKTDHHFSLHSDASAGTTSNKSIQ